MYILLVLALVCFGESTNNIDDNFNFFVKAKEDYEERIRVFRESHQKIPDNITDNRPEEARFRSLVHALLGCKKIPGMTVAITKGKQILFKEPFGKADIENNIPMTSKTRMGLGSVTKSLTAALLASLNDAGLLDWSKKLSTYWKDIGTEEPLRDSTIVDLASMREGVTRNDPIWILETQNNSREIAERMKYLQPTVLFRTILMYSNLADAVAGYIAANIIAKSDYGTELKKRILHPIGMNNATTSFAEAYAKGGVSKFYTVNEAGQYQAYTPEGNTPLDLIAPAGGVTLTLDDIIKYLFYLTSGGKNEKGNTVISSEALEFILAPKIVYNDQGLFNFDPATYPVSVYLNNYAIGWFVGTYNGHKLIWHKGAYSGGGALVAFLPNKNIAVSIQINSELAGYSDFVLMFAAFDWALGDFRCNHWLNQKTVCSFPCPWKSTCTLDALPEENEAKEIPQKAAPAKVAPVKRLGDNAEFAGTYTHPAYGVVTVLFNPVDSTFQLIWGTLKCVLDADGEQDGDTFILKCTIPTSVDPVYFAFYFGRGLFGVIERLVAVGVADNYDVVFHNDNAYPGFCPFPKVIPVEVVYSQL